MSDTEMTLVIPDVILSKIEQPPLLNNVVSTDNTVLTLFTDISLLAVIEIREIKSVLVNSQGPAGPSSGETVPYSKRTNFVGENIIYKGKAAPGSLDSQAVWQISKMLILNEDGDFDEKFANGNAEFTNVWSDHLTLTYT